MKRVYAILWFTTLIIGSLPVLADTEEVVASFDLIDFFLIIAAISIIVALGLISLRRFETIPGSLPIRKIAITAIITIIINSLIFAYIYRDVLL